MESIANAIRELRQLVEDEARAWANQRAAEEGWNLRVVNLVARQVERTATQFAGEPPPGLDWRNVPQHRDEYGRPLNMLAPRRTS